MLDSWGSPQPGLFTGDNYWEGHWDQCNAISRWSQEPNHLQPRYCTVEWQALIPVCIVEWQALVLVSIMGYW